MELFLYMLAGSLFCWFVVFGLVIYLVGLFFPFVFIFVSYLALLVCSFYMLDYSWYLPCILVLF